MRSVIRLIVVFLIAGCVLMSAGCKAKEVPLELLGDEEYDFTGYAQLGEWLAGGDYNYDPSEPEIRLDNKMLYRDISEMIPWIKDYGVPIIQSNSGELGMSRLRLAHYSRYMMCQDFGNDKETVFIIRIEYINDGERVYYENSEDKYDALGYFIGFKSKYISDDYIKTSVNIDGVDYPAYYSVNDSQIEEMAVSVHLVFENFYIRILSDGENVPMIGEISIKAVDYESFIGGDF